MVSGAAVAGGAAAVLASFCALRSATSFCSATTCAASASTRASSSSGVAARAGAGVVSAANTDTASARAWHLKARRLGITGSSIVNVGESVQEGDQVFDVDIAQRRHIIRVAVVRHLAGVDVRLVP